MKEEGEDEDEEPPTKNRNWEDNDMNTSGLEFLARGLAQFWADADIKDMRHLKSQYDNEMGFIMDMSKNDPDNDSPWDLSEGEKMNKARHIVRNTKHILLVISGPCNLMGSNTNGNKERVNKHVNGVCRVM